jgi:hypothetical protein
MVHVARVTEREPTGSQSEIVPGQSLGKYQIIERLAAGGMAELWLARVSGMLGFEKLVVIKRILPHLASRTDFVEMFLDEARIATTLNHPNLVQTYDVGVHGKSYFMAMEYLSGQDVRSLQRELAKRGERMPFEHALNIALGIAGGLHYAHEKKDLDGKPLNIVHRDVTPQNVIVTYDGGVKLLDFGIAKASNRINETRSGSFKGKVPYMSPEACRGDELDRRTDIFSLGILLYEMTLGRRLFTGETDFRILKQIAEGEINRPCKIDPQFDPNLEQIILRALEREPGRRFATARELQEALEQWAHDRRLRMSPLALADYMRAIFGEKIGAWQRATAEGDFGKLEQHVATLVAEREADLVAEESGAAGSEPSTEMPSMLAEPTVSGSIRLTGRPRLLGRAALLAFGVTAGVVGGLVLFAQLRRLRAAPEATHANQPAAAVASATSAEKKSRELPAPNDVPVEVRGSAAVMEVVTVPAGATLVLDGNTLPQRSPARLSGLSAGTAHLLLVRHGGSGVAQRFVLDVGEEASIEIDLRRSSHGTIRRVLGKMALRPGAAAAEPPRALATAKPAAPAPASPAARPAPAAPVDGEGTLVVASSPWCAITIDGQARGSTPINLKLKAGNHEVVLSNPDYHIKRTLSVDIQPNQTVRKKLDFDTSD